MRREESRDAKLEESPEDRLARLEVRVLPPAPRERAPPPNGRGSAGDAEATAQGEDDIDREERDLLRRIVEAPSLVYDPEPQRLWIVEDVIPDETLTLLSGEGGIGKTTLALQLAVAMRTDCEWLGMKVAQGAGAVRHFGGRPQGRKPESARDPQGGTQEPRALPRSPHPAARRPRRLSRAASTKLGAIAATPLWHALVRVVERLQAAPRHLRRAGRPVRRRRKQPPPRARLHRAAQATGDPAEARRRPHRPSVAHRHEHRQRPFRLDRLAQRPTRPPLFPAAEGQRRQDVRRRLCAP